MTILEAESLHPDEAETTSVLGRALRVLTAFDDRHPCWSLTDLARAVGMPKSTVHRVLQELVATEMLRRVDAKYFVGLKLLQISGASVHARLREVALPHLRRLRDLTGQTVHFAVLDGIEIVYLEKLSGHAAVPMPSRRGGRHFAACTAAGKALLALSDLPTRERAVRAGLPPLTRNTITDPVRLRAELERTAQRRLGIDNQEAGAGVVCAGVAIVGPDGRPLAAVSVSGSPQSLDLGSTSEVLSMARRSISQALPIELARQLQPA